MVLIDAHAVLHRAFHALPNFTSSNGEPTGALYGFSAFLIKIIKELKPDYIAACYDLPQPTFRHAAYENYKAQRPKMDDILAKQINRSRDILKAFEVPIYDSPGFEADDMLGTIVEQIKANEAKSYKLKTIIASGDLDTLQLVSDDNVVVYTLSKGIKEAVIYDEKAVEERYGFGPKLVPDFKGLKGDPSDNIIGVKGIGEKTATELIKKFGTIENLYKKIKKDPEVLKKEGFKPKAIEVLKEGEEEALFSKTLAEIRRDAPIKFSLESSAWKESFDIEKVKSLFDEFGFRSLISRIENNKGLSFVSAVTKESPLLERFKGQVPEKLFKEVEEPLAEIISEMEKTGILLDISYLKKLSKEYHTELEKLEKKIWKLAGQEFNINSPKQMGEIIFDKLGLKTKNRSTNAGELAKLKGAHPIIEEIVSYRELAKLLSTYIDALPKLADKNGRLHTTFDQAGTVTGRISSKNPNLQNIPKRTELGRNVRRAFIADNGFKLVSFDYSQIELRVLAVLSGDKKLLEIFKKGEDVHDAVASEVFGVSKNKVTPEMRRRAKVINFGIIYGMGINALKANLETTKEEAQKFYDEYFAHFSDVADYIEKVKEDARKKGFTETLFGRKRFFPEIKSSLEYVRKEAERMAANAPLQGTAADFIKLAMVRAGKMIKEKSLKSKARLLLQIHDELVFEIEEKSLAKIAPEIKKIMESVYEGDILMEAKAVAGKNWEDMVSLVLSN